MTVQLNAELITDVAQRKVIPTQREMHLIDLYRRVDWCEGEGCRKVRWLDREKYSVGPGHCQNLNVDASGLLSRIGRCARKLRRHKCDASQRN